MKLDQDFIRDFERWDPSVDAARFERELAETNQADIVDMDRRKRLAPELFLTQNRIYK